MAIQLRENEYVVSAYFAHNIHYAMTSMGVLWYSNGSGWVVQL